MRKMRAMLDLLCENKEHSQIFAGPCVALLETASQELTIFHLEDEEKQLITMTQAIIDMVQETFKT